MTTEVHLRQVAAKTDVEGRAGALSVEADRGGGGETRFGGMKCFFSGTGYKSVLECFIFFEAEEVKKIS